MSRVLGIVAEYNPFHNGHLYHLQQAMDMVKPDFVMAVMSGNFTQRGEPALADKWIRTEMALRSGIDLVLELPSLYACQTAELFAAGAVQILNQTGLVTHMAFGSEYYDLENLERIAIILADEPMDYKEQLKSNLNKGLSFPLARFKAIEGYVKTTQKDKSFPQNLINEILRGSNSILALEYLKSLRRLKSTMQPVIVPRVGSDYNSPLIQGEFSSATAIRNMILSKGNLNAINSTLPHASLEILKAAIHEGLAPVSLDSLEQLLLGLIRRASPEKIASWMDVEEGLENRIKKFASESTNIRQFLETTKTKRYTYTRLQRILIHGLLDINTEDMAYFQKIGGPQYLRILGFNTTSISLLNKLKKTSGLPIITKPSHYHRHKNKALNKMFEYDVLASEIYSLVLPNPKKRKGGQEFTRGVVRI